MAVSKLTWVHVYSYSTMGAFMSKHTQSTHSMVLAWLPFWQTQGQEQVGDPFMFHFA